MEVLTDEELQATYKEAIKLKLDIEFIIILEQEMKSRGIPLIYSR